MSWKNYSGINFVSLYSFVQFLENMEKFLDTQQFNTTIFILKKVFKSLGNKQNGFHQHFFFPIKFFQEIATRDSIPNKTICFSFLFFTYEGILNSCRYYSKCSLYQLDSFLLLFSSRNVSCRTWIRSKQHGHFYGGGVSCRTLTRRIQCPDTFSTCLD